MDIDVKEATSLGLPGNTGAKARHWFMMGHASASNGKPYREPRGQSKAMIKAHKAGYDKGALASKEDINMPIDVEKLIDSVIKGNSLCELYRGMSSYLKSGESYPRDILPDEKKGLESAVKHIKKILAGLVKKIESNYGEMKFGKLDWKSGAFRLDGANRGEEDFARIEIDSVIDVPGADKKIGQMATLGVVASIWYEYDAVSKTSLANDRVDIMWYYQTADRMNYESQLTTKVDDIRSLMSLSVDDLYKQVVADQRSGKDYDKNLLNEEPNIGDEARRILMATAKSDIPWFTLELDRPDKMQWSTRENGNVFTGIPGTEDAVAGNNFARTAEQISVLLKAKYYTVDEWVSVTVEPRV